MATYAKYFRWIMFVSGLLTCSMFLALISPERSIMSNFGETISGEAGDIVVRNWGALIGMSGVALIYGSFVEKVRSFVLVVTGVCKGIFIGLVLSHGSKYMSFGAGTAVIADSLMIVLFAAYLVASASVNRSEP